MLIFFLHLCATVNFCDVDPHTLNLNPDDIKHRIGPNTRAIMVVHYAGYPADIFHHGQPTAIAFGQRDVRQGVGSLPVAESIPHTTFDVPWFKHDRLEQIELYATAIRKVAENADVLMASAVRDKE